MRRLNPDSLFSKFAAIACVVFCASVLAAAERVDYDRQILPDPFRQLLQMPRPDEGFAQGFTFDSIHEKGAFRLKDGKAVLVPGMQRPRANWSGDRSTDPEQHHAAGRRRIEAHGVHRSN